MQHKRVIHKRALRLIDSRKVRLLKHNNKNDIMAKKDDELGLEPIQEQTADINQVQAQATQAEPEQATTQNPSDITESGKEDSQVDTEDQAGTDEKAGDDAPGEGVIEKMEEVVHEVVDKIEAIAREVFKKNRGVLNVLHFTSDHLPFVEKNDAIKHASTLGDRTIITKNRQQ